MATGMVYAGASAKKHGWVVRAQPASGKQVDQTLGNTVQMLRQTWDRPSDQIHNGHRNQGSHVDSSSDFAASTFQEQLQASMADRQGRFSNQL